MDTREKLIRIAHANPELRAKLLPLIKKEARDPFGRLPDPRRALPQWIDSVLETVNQSSQGFREIVRLSERAAQAAPRHKVRADGKRITSPASDSLNEANKYLNAIANFLPRVKRSLEEARAELETL